MKLQKYIKLLVALSLALPWGTVAADTLPEPIDWAPKASYQTMADVPDAAFHETEYKSYSGPIDGLASNEQTWTGFFRQGGRTLTIDLGEPKPITKIALEFRQDIKAGIYLPKYVEMSISQNGINWNRLGRISTSVSGNDAQPVERKLQLTFSAIQTRYVKVTFPVEVWVFARHLSISGPASYEAKPVTLAPQFIPNANMNPFLHIPGVNDILLVYTGAHEEKGRWMAEDFSPMVAYVEGGFIKGKMFDTMLFLPYYQVPGTKEGWTQYLNDLFAKGVQLDALNQAVGSLQNDLGAGYKEKVILTLPYPDPKQNEFGVLDNEGLMVGFSDKTTSLQNRAKALNWYYDQLMEKWTESQFEHLELAGLYWQKETFDSNTPEDKELVKLTSDRVHQDGYPLYWIPFYGANGYDRWSDYGFDHVILQPNYYANTVPPAERMNNLSDAAQKYHLGVEVEIDERALNSRYYYDLFYKQLDKGKEMGLDQDVTNAYYIGSKTLVTAARSSMPQARKIYDDMYRWMAGQYEGNGVNKK